MKIRMKMAVLGTFHGMENVRLGDVVEVPDDEGARYCKLGYAEPVADEAEEDTETATPPQDAEKRTTGTQTRARSKKS